MPTWMVTMTYSVKLAVLSIGIVGLIAFLVVKVTWLAILLYLLGSIIIFIFRITKEEKRKAWFEIFKDLFWRW